MTTVFYSIKNEHSVLYDLFFFLASILQYFAVFISLDFVIITINI